MLRLTELPETGGDTLWASGYEVGQDPNSIRDLALTCEQVCDRISPAYQKFLESLTGTYA